MIFVTVGTHEQQFNRLIKQIDKLVADGVINESVIMQTGYSTYEPNNCQWERFLPYRKMVEYVKKARIIITHGGPSSFIMPLQIGKIPIVVPRRHKFNEHVNDHQWDFSCAVAARMGSIIVVEDIVKLGDVIFRYDELITGISKKFTNNNAKFNAELDQIVKEL